MIRTHALTVLAAILAVAAPAALAQSSKVQTTSQANSESLKGAAQAPLRDLNVVRTQVPDVLVNALADPYARPKTKKCPELAASILALNDALGPDIDAPVETEQTLAAKGKPMALGAAAGFASDLIPFRGVVRQATGAAKHDQYVQQAILAGSTRRAYLKGLGEARGCKPPATPSHVLAGSEPPTGVNAGVDRGIKPRYPIKR
jgi:hypothetical protein